ncbi:MAG: excinuclease UvrABC helicase subunit UvrB [Parasphingorhabdus sp.]|jgi:excinuclease UvrABC helicase subunit UvrB
MPEKKMQNTDQGAGRRKILKGVTIAGSTFTLSNWTKPIVESVALPAHAQTTANALIATANFTV